MKIKQRIKGFFERTLAFWIIALAAGTCVVFLSIGTQSENGSITLNGQNAVISDELREIMEDYDNALYRVMNDDAPTDESTIKEFEDAEGLGGATSIGQVIARRLPDGNTDGGRGWQCSKYTAYLATGQRQYSTAHPDYGPVNGKDIVDWLVRTKGWKRIDQPVEGAIGSGGFNTKYGHTAEFLYWVAPNVAMVSDANYVPLTVATHTMNVNGWIWAVPGDYESPKADTEPATTPSAPTDNTAPDATESPRTASNCQTWYVKRGDTLGAIMRACEGYVRYGSAMRQYAESWISKKTGRSVYWGWTHGRGVGLYAGDIITRKGN